jgi:hypothetical protein
MPQIAITTALALGSSLASAAVGFLFQPSRNIEGERLKDLNAPKSNYGDGIPKPFGRVRVAGNLLWANKIIEVKKKKKKGKGLGQQTQTTYSYFGDFALLFCEGPIIGIRKLWFNSKLVYDQSGEATSTSKTNSTNWAAKYLRIYTGTSNQSPDSLIQASLGSGDTPAYRNRCYIVLERLPLEEFGNRFPQVSAEVVTAGTVASPSRVPLSSVLRYLCLQAKFDSSQIDTDLLEIEEIPEGGYLIDGYLVDKSKSPKETLDQLQQLFHFHYVEAGGKISFLPYERPSILSILPSDLAAHEFGQSRPNAIYQQARTGEVELPTQISLTFNDPHFNYQSSVVRAKREGNPSEDSNPNLTFPLSATKQQARAIAERILYLAWLRRRTFKFTLPPRYLYLEAGDVVTLPLTTGSQKVQLSKVTVGANLLLDCEAVAYDPSRLTVAENDADIVPTPNPVGAASDTNLLVLDIPLVQDSDSDNGLYLAADGDENWKGAAVYVSRNGGASYQFAKTLEQPSTKGTCNTTLGGGGGATVSVTINDGELESVAAGDLEAGENTALVGNEIIRFETATLTAARTYTLSNLVRGVRGTEAFISTHGADERFVLLSDYIVRVDGLTSDLGQSLQFKAITGDQSLEDVDAVSITPVGNSLKPYSPVNVTSTKDLTGAVTISWQRRDRKAGEATTYTNLPLSETSESYEVDVMNGATVVRTIATSSPSARYEVAQQVADWGSIQAQYYVNVYQLSSVVGRGSPRYAVLSPTTLAATPEIIGFTPTGAVEGDTVTVYGTGLTGTTSVSIGGTPVTGLSVVNDGELTFTLPAGAATGKLSITTPGGTVESSTGFAVNSATTTTINYEEVRYFL